MTGQGARVVCGSGCKWVQAPDSFLWHRPRLAHRISDSHQGRDTYLACYLACQTPTNPQLSYLAKGCWSNFTTFPTLPCSHSCWKRCICKICTCTSILLISSCPVASSIINETPTNLSSCHCHCAKPRMPDEKKADSMHVWFEKLT